MNHLQLMPILTIAIALTGPGRSLRADDGSPAEELSEVTGLEDTGIAGETGKMTGQGVNSGRPCAFRGKLGLGSSWTKAASNKNQGGQQDQEGQVETSFPDLYANLSGDCAPSDWTQIFGDVTGNYLGQDKKRTAHLNQAGVRLRPVDSLVVAFGKERNRRAPGLIVSPSDFIHSAQNLPGTEEQKTGEWLARLSWQESGQTTDLFILPVDATIENGMPAKDPKHRGSAVRVFRQFSNFDLSLAIGDLDETKKAGISSQGFLTGSWRVYGEAGYSEESPFLRYARRHSGSYLIGTGYDATKYSVRLEYYENSAGLSKAEFDALLFAFSHPMPGRGTQAPEALAGPFLRQKYVIANFNLIEVFDRFNLTETLIAGTEDSSWLALSRFEWLVNPRNVAGATLKNFDKREDGQFFARHSDWEASLDWKWSF